MSERVIDNNKGKISFLLQSVPVKGSPFPDKLYRRQVQPVVAQAGRGETISYYSQNFAVVVSHELVHAKVSFRDILFEYDFISHNYLLLFSSPSLFLTGCKTTLTTGNMCNHN